MGRLDLRDKHRDEDVTGQGSVDSSPTSGALGTGVRPLTEHQMTLQECIADAEREA